MKLFKYPALLLSGLAIFTASCNRDALEPKLTTSISDATAFDSPDRILGQVNGLYSAMKSGQYLGGRYFVYNDIRAENFMNELTNGVTGLQTWNHTLNSNSNEVRDLWGAIYYGINSCNVFLDGMASKGNTVAGSLANGYNGEARLLRALGYYHLLQMYARPYWDGNGSKPGVPLRLTGNKGSGQNDLARATVQQVYDQILADLNFAEQNLPLNQGNALNNTTRAHRNTAIALKVRVYLSMQKYADVITEANKIVPTGAPFVAATGVAHALQADITNVFKTPYTTTESIFSMPFTVNNLPGTQNALGHYYTAPTFASPAPGNGEYTLNGAGIVGDATWTATDRRRTGFVFTAPNTKRYLVKFPTGPQQTDYAPVIRYSEVLLSLAEAITRSTNTVDARAVALLNAVRGRSDASTVFTVGGFANAAALADQIMKERNIEFLGEGLRSPDLLRLGLAIPGKPTVNSIATTQSEYIWPIPASELLTNLLMTPNP